MVKGHAIVRRNAIKSKRHIMGETIPLVCREGHELRMNADRDVKEIPQMITCDERYNLGARENMVPETPELAECPITVPMSDLPSEAWVFYWASMTSDDPLTIQDQEKAYEGDINHGLLQTDTKGQVTLTLNCPQLYKVGGTTNSRHVHYIVENTEEGVWSTMKTMRFTCPLSRKDLETMLQDKTALVIFSLPREYFEKDHIPDTLNLPREDLDTLTSKVKERRITEFIQDNVKGYPEIQRRLQAKELEIHDVPIVTYCMNDTCKSSGRLLEHLYESGFHNVKEYTPGLQGWRDKVSDLDVHEVTGPREEEDTDTKEDTDKAQSKKGERRPPEYTEEMVPYEGVEYLVDKNASPPTILNEDYEILGTCVFRKGKIEKGSVTWTHEQARRDHESLRITEEPPEDTRILEPEPEPEPESTPQTKETDTEESSSPDTEVTRETLMKRKKPELQEIASQIAGRDPSSYSLPTKRQSKASLIQILLECQGRPVKGTGTGTGTSKVNRVTDLEGTSVSALRKLITEMAQRDPGTYKVSLTSKNKTELTRYIMTCRGQSQSQSQSSPTVTKRRGSRKQKGWGYS
jgi:rhodanese-related sulfurtransferase